MAQFNVFDYTNQIIGQVEASDAVEAWSKAGKKFENILDVRQAAQSCHGWVDKPFKWYYPKTSKWLSVSGKRWGNDGDDNVAVITLPYEMIDDLRSELEPEEYSGVIEEGNIVVMAGDADGYHYIKAFPTMDGALAEAGKLVSRFETYDEMEERYPFEPLGYVGLSRGAA